MRKVISFTGLFLCLLIFTGCSTYGSTQGYMSLLDRYYGLHIDQMVTAWGPPQGEYVYADGRRLYTFVEKRKVSAPYGRPYFGFGSGFGSWGYGGIQMYPYSETREYFCRTLVETDRKGKITGYKFNGNGCLAKTQDPKGKTHPGTGLNRATTPSTSWKSTK